MSRMDHLRYCAFVSVRKRALWIVALALLLGAVALVLGLGAGWAAGVALLTVLLAVVIVAQDSVRRHSEDPEAQPSLSP